MKPILLLAAVLLQPSAPSSTPQHFRYQRQLIIPPGAASQTCAVLDASVFAHAASESLDDLRLYTRPSFAETPFNLSISGTQSDEDDVATVSHLGALGDNIVFDLRMPSRPYSAVILTLAAQNFTATATITGYAAPGAPPAILGNFPLFDLTSQHLSRFTTLPLQESTFPVLHIGLHIIPAPGSTPGIFRPSIVEGAVVPPSREAQTLYTPVASTNTFVQQGRDTLATIHVPAHVPVQQLRILLASRFTGNFLRSIEITATPDDSHDPSAAEVFSGEISHVRLKQTRDMLPVNNLQTTIDMPLGANLRSSATVRIRISNGTATPIPLAVAQLEMRQHKLCFDATPPARSYLLMYGSPKQPAPIYAYAHTFTPMLKPAIAILGSEQRNPSFTPQREQPTLAERYPDLPWVMLLAVIVALGSMALRRSRSRRD